jgi:DEAD/DEAH box helicase domain-containing protein
MPRRRSVLREASRVFSDLIQNNVRALTFVRTRRQVELVFRRVREILDDESPSLSGRVSSYRGAYIPEDRRRIEKSLARGELLGLATTNALELGIDIGDIDASILTGYPGSIASAWQQAGRSGRRGSESLSVLLGRDDPMDQYLMRHPDFFFGRAHEHARIAPANQYVLGPHLLCAAYEMPLTVQDTSLFGPTFEPLLESLVKQGDLVQRRGGYFLSPTVVYPAGMVNIRTVSPDSYNVVEQNNGQIMEIGIEAANAFKELHAGAVYLHYGDTYLITELDLVNHTALAIQEDLSYYTRVRELIDTRVMRLERKRRTVTGVEVSYGEIDVTSQVVGYKTFDVKTDNPVGEHLLSLPDIRFDTKALWFEIPSPIAAKLSRNQQDLAGALHAAEHAAISVLPLFDLCDRRDIGGLSTTIHPETGQPTIFIYDGYPGGIGIAEHGYEIIERLWSATLEVITACPCVDGCPSCIYSPKCGNNNHPLDKRGAANVLQSILGMS